MKTNVCEVCRNEYDKTFVVTMNGKDYEFDCFECAIQSLSPRCASCGVPIIGHGAEAANDIFCSGHCARKRGHQGIRDRADPEAA